MHHAPVSDRHSDRAGRNRPAVVLLHHPDLGNRHCLREINAGMEEEGVPCRIESAPRHAENESYRTEGGPYRAENGSYRTEDGPYRAENGSHPTGNAVDGGARELAFAAAQASNLDVGIGVDAAGYICVHHAKLPPDAPAVAGPPSSARTMGHNAARLVVGIPFKQQEGFSHA
ncbi:glycerol dehydratase reactivase beta/small subunit family protein [Streptosporangium subroseum]|uniref:glycerol dehydratase reactivase beta/small subunit family protein n=1 Tax=Streptosporangium subroseum TaxID=106412 RepID=UPI00308DD09B|nr:glycerol dehydratase reactivase beta/small subunit family protein [Streptosporangium subroseum]